MLGGAALVVQVLEIAHHIADLADNGKAAGKFPDNGGELGRLGAVDHADDHAGGLAPEGAPAGQQGGAVVQTLDNGLGQLLRLTGDDLKAHGAAAALVHAVHDGAGHEAVQHAHEHRLNAEAVHKEGNHGHDDVQGEGRPEKVEFRAVLVDQGGDIVRAASVGAGFQQHEVGKAADETRHQGGR